MFTPLGSRSVGRLRALALGLAGALGASCRPPVPSVPSFEGEIDVALSSGVKTTFAVKGRKARTTGDNPLILDGDAKAIYTFEHDAHAYAEVPFTVPPSKRAVVDAGRTETIAGHDCGVVRVTGSGGAITEACLAREVDLLAVGPFALLGGLTYEGELGEGLTLRVTHLDAGGAVTDSVVVTRVEPKAVSDEGFSIPAR